MRDLIAYGYSVIVIAGGLFGFLKAGFLIKKELIFLGSYPSLIAGSGIGCCLFYGALQANSFTPNYHPLVLFSGLLFSVMFIRFLKTGKFMPAGMMACLR